MGNYAWRTEHREGRSDRKPTYSVKWEWYDPDFMSSYKQYTDLTYATNAERAISKVRKKIAEDFPDSTRRDVVIIHAVPIDGPYYREN